MTTSLFAQGPGTYEYTIPVADLERRRQMYTKSVARALKISAERVNFALPETVKIEINTAEPTTFPMKSAITIDGKRVRDHLDKIGMSEKEWVTVCIKELPPGTPIEAFFTPFTAEGMRCLSRHTGSNEPYLVTVGLPTYGALE